MDEPKKIWKECGRGTVPRVVDVVSKYDSPKKILIVFWHGIGDLLMFAPLLDQLRTNFPQHHFDLGLIPGVGHTALFPDGLELPEAKFLENHDAAFVLSFHMVEGSNAMTKAEYCYQTELGPLQVLNTFKLPTFQHSPSRLVGVHLQGTCLPGSTNPDEELAHKIWDDIKTAGYIPIDLHMEHVFHNPVNKPYSWVTRGCRDLVPSLETLKMLIGQCHATVAVASGPFVLSLCRSPERTIYLQKHHKIECYTHGFKQVVDILNYDSQLLIGMLRGIGGMA